MGPPLGGPASPAHTHFVGGGAPPTPPRAAAIAALVGDAEGTSRAPSTGGSSSTSGTERIAFHAARAGAATLRRLPLLARARCWVASSSCSNPTWSRRSRRAAWRGRGRTARLGSTTRSSSCPRPSCAIAGRARSLRTQPAALHELLVRIGQMSAPTSHPLAGRVGRVIDAPIDLLPGYRAVRHLPNMAAAHSYYGSCVRSRTANTTGTPRLRVRGHASGAAAQHSIA
jgi:hypothetical protein